MDNMWLSVLSGILFIITALNGLPLNADTDVVATKENGLVYVFNIYAVKNVRSEVVGKMLSHQSIAKIPAIFEPIGSIMLADEDPEPFTLAEFADFLEDFGVTVDKIDDENDPKVIEVKFDDFAVDSEAYMLSLEDLIKFLQSEGIIIKISQEGNVKIFQVEFDESVKSAEDQPFSLEELADFFEDEGFPVELKVSDHKVISITMKLDISTEGMGKSPNTTAQNGDEVMEKKHERLPEPSIANAMEKKSNDKKIDTKNEHDNAIPLDFITRSDSLNKIRRRRSSNCPECKTGNLIKQFINNYSTH